MMKLWTDIEINIETILLDKKKHLQNVQKLLFSHSLVV